MVPEDIFQSGSRLATVTLHRDVWCFLVDITRIHNKVQEKGYRIDVTLLASMYESAVKQAKHGNTDNDF